MCNERERLIGFVYDEVGASERRQIEAHLAECPECRAEIRGLRSTRQDLLAWGVPDHEPIWRPLAPVRPVPAWRQIPVWAMAAAASLVLASGAVGGLTVRWLSPVVPAASVTADTRPAVALTPVAQRAPAASDLTTIEARLLDRLRRELRQELVALSSRGGAGAEPAVTRTAGAREVDLGAMTRRLVDLEQWRDDQIGFNWALNEKLQGVSSRAGRLNTEWEATRMNLLRVSDTPGPGLGR